MIAWPPGAWQHAASGPGHHHNYNHLGFDVILEKHHQPLYSQVVSWKFGNNYVYPTKQVLLFLCLCEYSLKTILCWILITLMTQILIRKLSKEQEISVYTIHRTLYWLKPGALNWGAGTWTSRWFSGNISIFLTQWDAELDLLMVPNGELHIAAVDYSHTHHPYFCIVKHR